MLQTWTDICAFWFAGSIETYEPAFVVLSYDYADYADVDMMQFYLDRAKLLEKLKEVLKYRLIFNKVPPNL